MNKDYVIIAGIFLVVGLAFVYSFSGGMTGAVIADTSNSNIQVAKIGLTRSGYSPSVITVEAGKPVLLVNDGSLQGCGLYPVQQELGIAADFSKYDEYEFTPTKEGTYSYSCSMGMWRGTIKVV